MSSERSIAASGGRVGEAHGWIRPAEPVEAELLSWIAYCAKASWGYADGLMARFGQANSFTPAQLAQRDFQVYETGGGAVGFYELGGSPLHIEHLWVLPTEQGKGVGRALVEHACARARELGAEALFVVSESNAVGFYRRCGFVACGERESRLEPGLRLPRLRRELTGARNRS